MKNNLKRIHTAIVQSHLQTRTNNKVINDIPPKINAQEQTLYRYTGRSLAQLRANKYLLWLEYLHKISPDTNPTPTCPLYNAHTHNTNHLYTCQHYTLIPIALWEDPVWTADLFAAGLWYWGGGWSDHGEGRSTKTEKRRGRHLHNLSVYTIQIHTTLINEGIHIYCHRNSC